MKKIFFLFLLWSGCCFLPLSAVAQEDNAWGGFNIGSWALYSIAGGMQQKHTLINRTEEKITVRMETIVNGTAISSQDIDVPLKPLPSQPQTNNPAEVKEGQEEVNFKGQEYSCKTYETQTAFGNSKSWVSAKVPGSIIKTSLNGETAMELLDFEAKP